ncbi:MAG: AMP-binding enzyme, partial [Gemmatimonadaceae bacterium]
LDRLSEAYPEAKVAHAFASTEAGVAFEIGDGRSGFPAALVGTGPNASGVDMRVEDGSLRIRSPRAALRYLGDGASELHDADGFVDTGDMLELQDDRYYFRGRRGGIINVGGLKVHPEEVEAVLNRHPAVRMSLVKARKNPITGAIVVADVVLTPDAPPRDALEVELRTMCRTTLAAHKVPALIRVVSSLAVMPSGKMVRQDA